MSSPTAKPCTRCGGFLSLDVYEREEVCLQCGRRQPYAEKNIIDKVSALIAIQHREGMIDSQFAETIGYKNRELGED